MRIEELIILLERHLQNQTLKDFQSQLVNCQIEISQENVIFSKDHYTRNLIYRNKDFEIYIIGWNPFQGSKFHCHPENGCLMKILQGSLTETIKTNDKTKSYTRNIGSCSYIHDEIGSHKVENDNDYKSISLHIYSPPSFYD